jgi:hypothetical protein
LRTSTQFEEPRALTLPVYYKDIHELGSADARTNPFASCRVLERVMLEKALNHSDRIFREEQVAAYAKTPCIRV